jgi:hypothetical protein
MSTRRTAGYGCGCARKAASGTRCRAHHNLDEYLTAYLDGAGLRDDPKGPLFRTIGRGTGKLTRTVLPQANAYAMIGRRAAAAGIATKLGNHSFRATGITAVGRSMRSFRATASGAARVPILTWPGGQGRVLAA